jgi:putative chitinase
MELDVLNIVAPQANLAVALALIEEMPRYGITGRSREAAFIANVCEETRGLTVFEENLNYSPERLMKVWPRRFPDMQAALAYARRPEALANKVYANRMGNGDEQSGDGWLYHGRGPAQLTGRDNYLACAHGLGEPVDQQPELILVPRVGAQSACWFWRWKGLSALADADDFESLVRKWNGGLMGMEGRESYYGKLLEEIA